MSHGSKNMLVCWIGMGSIWRNRSFALSIAIPWMHAGIQESTELARLCEDLLYREFEAGHDVSAGQNVGFGEGNDVGW
jgi:hypothetical protein